jgi:ubiquitin C-terminal hydrolase
MNCIRCNCGAEHITFEDFIALSLPIPRSSIRITHANSLTQCLDEYTKLEEIQEYHCDKCKKKDKCKRQTVIWRYPPVLILHLKRFYAATWRKEKLDTLIQFPTELDLSSYKGKSSTSFIMIRTCNS